MLKILFSSILFLSIYISCFCENRRIPEYYPNRVILNETDKDVIIKIKTVSKPDDYRFIELRIFYSPTDVGGIEGPMEVSKDSEYFYLKFFRKPIRGIKKDKFEVFLVNEKKQIEEVY